MYVAQVLGFAGFDGVRPAHGDGRCKHVLRHELDDVFLFGH